MADDKWKDCGHASHGMDIVGGILDTVDGTELHNVHNNETGEDKVVYVGPNQTVGEAIANAQFKKD